MNDTPNSSDTANAPTPPQVKPRRSLVDPYTCQKCGADRGKERRLAGGYYASLCRDCTNAWAAFCQSSNAYLILRHAEATHQANVFSAAGPDRADWAMVGSSGHALNDAEQRMFAEAKAWVAIKKPAEPDLPAEQVQP